jgi:hypothetical protein
VVPRLNGSSDEIKRTLEIAIRFLNPFLGHFFIETFVMELPALMKAAMRIPFLPFGFLSDRWQHVIDITCCCSPDPNPEKQVLSIPTATAKIPVHIRGSDKGRS